MKCSHEIWKVKPTVDWLAWLTLFVRLFCLYLFFQWTVNCCVWENILSVSRLTFTKKKKELSLHFSSSGFMKTAIRLKLPYFNRWKKKHYWMTINWWNATALITSSALPMNGILTATKSISSIDHRQYSTISAWKHKIFKGLSLTQDSKEVRKYIVE